VDHNKPSHDTSVWDRNLLTPTEEESREILEYVLAQLQVKGYNPIAQIAGYLITGDPTYITAHNNARGKITKLDRDDVLAWMIKHYIETKLGTS
jgi:uncharacterized protein (UPF0297 family)